MSMLNFQEAIAAHEKWKETLKALLEKTQSNMIKLNPDLIEQDNRCVLGKWLYSIDNEKYLEIPTFASVQIIHAQFHKCAAEVVRKFYEGNTKEAEIIFKIGCFSKSSIKIIHALTVLEQELNQL